MKKLLQLKKTFQQVLLSMIVTLGLTVINVAAQTTITIGDPASTNYNYQIPVNNLWHYSYTQQILLASEIGMDGNISVIRFKYNTGSLTDNNNWTVYLGQTTNNAFTTSSSWIPLASLTEVFSGTVTASAGWITLTLTTPFPYNSALGNLVVAVDENSPNYVYTSTMFPYNNVTGNRAIHCYSDGTNPNPASPPTGYLLTRINTIQLDITPFIACDVVTLEAGTISTPDSVCMNIPFVITTSGTTSASGMTRVWQSRTPAGTGTWTTVPGAIGATLPVSTGIMTPTEYRLIVHCTATGAYDTTNFHTVELYDFTRCYCTPAPSSTDGTGIINVNINDGAIDNATGAEPGHYGDYTAISFTEYQNAIVPFTITYGHTYTYYTRIWIDWNNDGIFENTAPELVFNGETAGGSPNTMTGTFQIPFTATPGPHRIRIGGADGTIPDPCYTGSWASFEDYTLNVLALPNCTTIPLTSYPSPLTPSFSSEFVCGSGEVMLGLTETIPPANGYTYQWQSSTSATGPWTNVATPSTLPNITVTVTSDTYFRCLVLCEGANILTSTNAFIESVIPVAPTLFQGQTCGPGSVELTGTVGSGTIFWYEDMTSVTPIGVGDTFNTPDIDVTTTFYASGGAYTAIDTFVGTGTLSSSSTASPFYYGWGGYKHQYIILASELEAIGMTPGTVIDRIGVNVTSPSPSTTFNDFSLSAALTTTNNLSSGYITGLPVMYGPLNYTPITGLNYFTFSTPIVWDGTSNLVLQTCFNNGTYGGTSVNVTYGNTSTILHRYNYADASTISLVCGSTSGVTATTRPNFYLFIPGCESSRVAVVAHVRDTPTVTIPILDGEYCVFNDEFRINATPTQPAVNTFLWSDGSTDSFMVASSTYGVEETFWVEVTNEWGCASSDSVKLVLNPSPIVNLGNDTLVCNGGEVSLDAGAGGTSYYWNTGETTQRITVDDGGDYYVLVGNEYGCIGTDTIHVEVSDDYMPSISGIGVDILSTMTFKFTPYLSTYVVSYEWDFGDGSPLVYSANPIHTYDEPGTYLVTLRIFSTCGSTVHYTYASVFTSNHDIATEDKSLIIYPNPTNDKLSIEAVNGVKLNKVTIVNTLGQELLNYSINDQPSFVFDVHQLPSGMYYLKIDTNKGVVLKKIQVLK